MRKNFRKLPNGILARTQLLMGDKIVVGCVKQYSPKELRAGKLKQFGIVIDSAGRAQTNGAQVVPPETAGKYSLRNKCGWERVNRDLPKVIREIPFHVKDWHGNWHSGTYPRECYAVEFIKPTNIKIEARIQSLVENIVVVAFRLSEVLDKASPDFNDKLLNGVNIMFENVGAYGVELEKTPLSEFVNLIRVPWRIFPVGTCDLDSMCKIIVRGRTDNEIEKAKQIIKERLEFLQSLGAKTFIQGTDAFGGYIGAELQNQVFVFDNTQYGNAAYVLKGEWEVLSKKTRGVLRKDFHDKAVCVPHNGDWKAGIAKAVKRME